jgi:peptide/nickel transport system substrate-binding protein
MELAAMYDSLMFYDTGTGRFEPRTAESLTPNADLTEWTLKIRPNIRFTDGTAYDAEAVVFNLRRHIELRGRSLQLVSFMTDFATPDPLTVVIKLNGPNSTVPFSLASAPGMIASPAAIRAQGGNFGINPGNAGAGPFMFSSFAPKEAVVLRKNPDYWNGPVYLDELRFVNLVGQQSNVEALKAGTLQATLLREPAFVAEARDAGFPGLEAAQSAGNTITMNNGVRVACSGGQPATVCAGQPDGTMVATRTATSDKRVRQAVAAAINLDTLNQRVYQGKADLDTALLAESSRWSSGIAGPRYDLDRAKRLVNEAKADGWDGTIRVSCHNGLPEWGVAVQTMLELAGFRVVRDDNKPVAENIAAVVTRKDFDIACFGISILDEEPFQALSREFSFTGYANAEVQAAIRAGGTSADDADKQRALDTIARAYTEDVPFLSLSPAVQYVALARNVQGATQSVNSIIFFDKAGYVS